MGNLIGSEPTPPLPPSSSRFRERPRSVRREARKPSRKSVRKISDYYRLESIKLGEGSFGTVRRGIHLKTGEKVAVKTIMKQKVKNIESLRREIDIMRNANHPNIITLLDAFEDPKLLFIVMELCSGGELFDHISSRGCYSEADDVHIFRQILLAVSYLHSNNIAHRDLKPENFLFSADEINSPLKLIDFGLSQLYSDTSNMKTRVGTPYYIAPEVLRRSYDASCDMWSVGVILYILLCGYPPFYGDTEREIYQSIESGSYDFPPGEWDSISNQGKDLISKLLLVDPSSRLSAKNALQHPWFQLCSSESLPCHLARVESISPNVVERLHKFAAQNKFKKVVLNTISRNLNPEEIGKLKTEFTALDLDGDGVITMSELSSSLKKSGLSPSASQMHDLMSALDQDGNGKLDYQEFVAAVLDKHVYLKDEILSHTFSHFDKSGSGVLTTEDIKKALNEEDHYLVDQIVGELDKDSNGVIDFEEFKIMMNDGEKSGEVLHIMEEVID